MSTVHTVELSIDALCELHRVAQMMADWFAAGDVVTLDGPLGAGKTTTAQAIGRALGITEPMTSPTFALMHRYDSGRLPLVHGDLYRLGPEGACALDGELDDILAARDSVLLVEWACYAPWLAQEATLRLEYTLQDNDSRRLKLTSARPLPSF